MHFAYPKGGFGRASCLESGLHNHGLQSIKVVALFWKKLGRVVKNKSQVSRWSYWRKTLFEVFVSFFSFGLRANPCQTFVKKIMTGLPKLPSTVSEFFEREKLSHQENFFPSVSDFELRIFGLLVKKFWRLTKTALYVSRGDFRRKKVPNKNHFSPSVCEDELMIFRILAKSVQISPKLLSTCPN